MRTAVRLVIVLGLLAAVTGHLRAQGAGQPDQSSCAEETWQPIAFAFQPPSTLAEDLGQYRSPLVFDDGQSVKTPEDWQRRRQELLKFWHASLGAWPPLIDEPAIEIVETSQREDFTQKKVWIEVAEKLKVAGYLLIPKGDGPHPAVLVVYYDPETGIGLGESQLRDFASQLARRGFVTLSIGWPTDYTQQQSPARQPLSSLAYVAANCYNALATLPEVDPARVGVVGHSFGGKWALFASCLYEKFACGVWSDPGIVFDENRPNVNYCLFIEHFLKPADQPPKPAARPLIRAHAHNDYHLLRSAEAVAVLAEMHLRVGHGEETVDAEEFAAAANADRSRVNH